MKYGGLGQVVPQLDGTLAREHEAGHRLICERMLRGIDRQDRQGWQAARDPTHLG
jgi:hypothetical protein